MVKIIRLIIFCALILVFNFNLPVVIFGAKTFNNEVYADNKPSVNIGQLQKEEGKKSHEPNKEADLKAQSNIKPPVAKPPEDGQREDEQDMMDKALDLLEVAEDYWEKGDIENTLIMLDKAYALILETDGDPEVARQKDDLRLLISKRILAAYSSRMTVANGKASEIQLVRNADVDREIRSFQGVERDFFISSYHRSGLYRPYIVKELKKAGMPEELSWLPLVESGYKVLALSRARALGLWQFIPSTGYKFGLGRDEWIDERMDVEKSTAAAIAYLRELHDMFGDWKTVLAAYNCGEGRVLRVISRQRINYFDRFWDLYNQLPRETARYVPRFLATLHIVNDPKKFGMDLSEPLGKPIEFETVKVNKVMRLQDIASKINLPEEILNLLNSELRHRTTPDREYNLKIPIDYVSKFNLALEQIPEAEKPQIVSRRMVFSKHRVKQGETIASIARRYKVPSATILSYNDLSAKRGLVVGQSLRIPVVQVTRVDRSKTDSKSRKSKSTLAEASRTYKVKKGDTLLNISNRFDIPVAQLREMNKMKGNTIRAGQVLRVSAAGIDSDGEEKTGAAKKASRKPDNQQVAGRTLSGDDVEKLGANKYIVTKGDNLHYIAKKNNISVNKLLELNKLSGDETIKPGQVLVVR